MCRQIIQHSSLPQQSRHGVPEPVKVRGRGVPTSYENQVPPISDLGKACRLPESPFYTVSYHRVPDSLPHRKAKPRDGQIIGPRPEYQHTIGPAFSFASCCCEALRFSYALVFAHGPPGAIERILISYRKPLASLEHTAFQDTAAASGTHAGSEAMHSAPASLAGLIGSFRHKYGLRYLTIILTMKNRCQFKYTGCDSMACCILSASQALFTPKAAPIN